MLWTLFLSAAVMAGTSLDGPLRAVAALRGEPSVMSAAGLTKDEAPILTLENATAFDGASSRLRLLVVGGDQPGASAVLAFVRWFKTAASPRLRQRWTVSALPWAQFEAADHASLERWITFQAPDLLVQIRDDGGKIELASITSEVVGTEGASTAILKRLSAARTTRSPLHDAIANRVRREPLEIARLLANRYPETPSLSYIPAVAWTSSLRLAATSGDLELAVKVRQQTAALLSGDQGLFGGRIQLTSVAGAMVFADLGGEFWTRAIMLDAARLASALERPTVER